MTPTEFNILAIILYGIPALITFFWFLRTSWKESLDQDMTDMFFITLVAFIFAVAWLIVVPGYLIVYGLKKLMEYLDRREEIH